MDYMMLEPYTNEFKGFVSDEKVMDELGLTKTQFEAHVMCQLYLDDSGNIQYLNLQNCGTTEGDYEFVLDEQGHNRSNLTFTKEEQEKYGLSNMDDYFNSLDLETYMELETKNRIQELTEINMRLVTEKEK